MAAYWVYNFCPKLVFQIYLEDASLWSNMQIMKESQ